MRHLPLLLALLIPLLAGCASTAGGQAVAPPPEASPTLFSVGATTVTLADYTRRLEADIGPALAELLAQGQSREQVEQLANESNVRGAVYDRMLQDALLLDYARRNGIGVDPAAIDAAAPNPAAADPLAEQGDTPTTVDQRAAIAREQLLYEVIARNTRADMFHARHILLPDEAAADQALADLAAGADFAALAEERSTDTGSAELGGDLGWTPRGDFVAAFEEAAFSAPLNTPTKVESEFGWHVLEVLERQEQRPFDSFERLRQSGGAQGFYEQSFLPWYEELRQQAEASGALQLDPAFDPNSVPLPFPVS